VKCPMCGSTDDRVIESRQDPKGTTIRRRRECGNCEYRFTSYETVEKRPLTVIKKSGRREIFDLKKTENGIQRAIAKRNIAHSTIESFLHIIADEAVLMSRSTHEIRSETIGELILDKLFKLDRVAYVRFASVHRQFESVEDFIEVIEKFAPNALKPEDGENSKLPLFLEN